MTGIPCRFAIVGVGGHARAYFEHMSRIAAAGSGRHVAQVAIPSDHELYPETVADLRGRGVALFLSLREMLAAMRHEIDVVSIPTGIHMHRHMAIAAMEAGCHVIVEKPAAGVVQDVDAMRIASSRTGHLCAVGFQHLYQPEFARLKQWICEDRFGALKDIRCFGSWPRQPSYYARNNWAGKLSVGEIWVLDSPHNNALSHALNCMCYLSSHEPDRAATPVRLEAELYRAHPIESADTVTMRVETKEDVSIYFGVSHATDRLADPVFEIVAEDASLSMTYAGDLTISWHNGSIEQHQHESSGSSVFEGMVSAIESGTSPACNLDVARGHSCCVSASFEGGIADIPATCKETQSDGTIVVKGLTDVLAGACEQRALLSELELDWARPTQPVDLEEYCYFEGKHLVG